MFAIICVRRHSCRQGIVDAHTKVWELMKRGIAGSLIFTIFDRSALYNMINRGDGTGAKYYARPTDVANPGEYAASRLAITGAPGSLGVPFEDIARRIRNVNARGGSADIAANGQVLVNDMRPVNYVDQMPPFDVVLSAQNEMGHRMGMQIFGVELLNQGSGVSIDDIVVEAQMTWVARSILDWRPLGTISQPTGGLA